MTRSTKTKRRGLKSGSIKRESRRSTGWDWRELGLLSQLGLLSYTPNQTWREVSASEAFDLAGEVLPRIGRPHDLERKYLCSWVGISYACWRDRIWRWAMELRYRHGDEVAIALLDQDSRNRLDVATDRLLRSYRSNDFLDTLLNVVRDDKCHTLIAYEYAYARAKNHFSESHPLHQRLKDPAFWEYMQDRYPGPLRGTGAMRYLRANDQHLDSITGQILSFLIGLEDPRAGKTADRFPELVGASDVPEGIDVDEIVPLEEFSKLTDCYRERLDLPWSFFESILNVWMSYAADEKLQKDRSTDSTIGRAVAILSKRHKDLYAEYRSQVGRFRREFVRPLADKGETSINETDPYVARLNSFRGALRENPFLNCVLRTECFGNEDRRKKTEVGRPAETARGVTCAHAIRLMEREFPEGSPISVSDVLIGAEKLSSHILPLLAHRNSKSQYAVVAPLLSCLFRHEITPSQVKTLASRYEKRLNADSLLYNYRTLFGDHRIKTPSLFRLESP